jgi:hypothetical protein
VILRTRGIKISVRLNRGEHEHLKKQSEKSGLPMEVLVRSLIMGIDIKPIPADQLGEIRRQLSSIGNNINQIARVANGTGHIDKEDIDAIKTMQTQIWRQVKVF